LIYWILMQGRNLDSVEDEEIRVEVGDQQCPIQSVSSGQVCIYIKKESFHYCSCRFMPDELLWSDILSKL